MVGGGGLYQEILRVRDARALIGASAVSQLGDWLYNAVLLGYVYAATGSAGWVGAATFVRLLPWVVLIPVGGMLADRYDKRTVLLLGDTARCVLMLGLTAVVAAEGPVVLVLALTMLASVAGSAERPATIALLPRLVGESRLGPANALLHTVQELGVVLGPAIGAALLLVAPDYAAFLVNAGTFAFSAALISTIPRQAGGAAATDSGGAGQQFRRGLRIAWSTRFVVPLILVVAMAELVYGAQTVQLVVYSDTELGLGSGGYGWLLAASGVGGVLSAVFNGRLAAGTRVSAVVIVSAALYCATQLLYPGTDVLAVVLLGTVVGGAGYITSEVVAETALARVVPDDALGRVLGVMQGVSIAMMLAGAALAPVLIDVTSLSTSFAVLGVVTLVVVVGSRAALGGLDALSRERAETLAARVAVIDRLPLVTGVPRLVLERLAHSSQVVPLPPGVDVVVEGAPAHAFYAVLEGAVVVHHDGTAIDHIGAGDYFGERGLLDEAPRNATVTTEEQSSLLRVEGDVFLDILQTAPTVRTTVTRVSSSRHGSRSDGALVDDPAWSAA
jgi:MFS family permease